MIVSELSGKPSDFPISQANVPGLAVHVEKKTAGTPSLETGTPPPRGFTINRKSQSGQRAIFLAMPHGINLGVSDASRRTKIPLLRKRNLRGKCWKRETHDTALFLSCRAAIFSAVGTALLQSHSFAALAPYPGWADGSWLGSSFSPQTTRRNHERNDERRVRGN